MQVTDKGQVTIPKHIRDAAGVRPGSEVAFALEGGKIVISKISTGKKIDRRAKLRAAAAKVHAGLDPRFRQMSADQIMAFLRTDDEPI
jgi:antitoxin PrlF